MDYKRDIIKDHLYCFIDENPNWEMKGAKKRAEDLTFDELHHQAFNQDYFIIGTWKAQQWCGDKVFEIINFIKDYEQNNFGQVTTDLSNPEKVVNMYAYILGEEVVEEYLNQDCFVDQRQKEEEEMDAAIAWRKDTGHRDKSILDEPSESTTDYCSRMGFDM